MPSHRHVGSFGEASSIFTGRWGNSAANAGQGSSGGIDNDNNRYGFTTYAGGASDENGQTVTVTSTTPHNNVQPYAVTRYIIKAKPDDVEQFNPVLGPGLSASDANGQTANITLTSTEIGLKVLGEDFTFDGAGKLKLVDANYRTGEVIEKFDELLPYNSTNTANETKTITLYGGSNFALNTIPYAVVNAGGIALTNTYIDIEASKVNYMCPAGTKTITYRFVFFHGRGSSNPLIHVRLRLGPSTAGGSTALIDEEVTMGYKSNFHQGSMEFFYEFPFEIVQTAEEEDHTRGKIFKDNWEGIAREIRLEVREYTNSYQSVLYRIDHQDGAGVNRFSAPRVGVETIAR